MEGRIRPRKHVKHIFDNFLIFLQKWPPSSEDSTPELFYSFPPVGPNDNSFKSAVNFAFPCNAKVRTIETFVFVITSEDARWKFGYCRLEPLSGSIHDVEYHKCSIFLSEIPYWDGVFFKALNYIASISRNPSAANSFLESLYRTNVFCDTFERLMEIKVPGFLSFKSQYPRDDVLPSTLENRCLSEFYNAFTPETMIAIFASLLAERNIIIVSKRLSTLSSIVLACNIILNPLCWQHIFIPVIPHTLSDYLEAPMPYVIGVPLSTWKLETAKRRSCQSRCVQVDADSDTVITPFSDDLNNMPKDIYTFLKKILKGGKNGAVVHDNGLAHTFLQVFVKLIGHYEAAIISGASGKAPNFDHETFISIANASYRSYLRSTLTRSQMFEQFLAERTDPRRNKLDNYDLFQKEIRAKEDVPLRPDIQNLRGLSIPAFTNTSNHTNKFLTPPDIPPKPFQRSASTAGRDLPTPRPRPKPNPTLENNNRVKTCDPRLVTQWSTVLSDLKTNPIHRRNNPTPTLILDNPTTNSYAQVTDPNPLDFNFNYFDKPGSTINEVDIPPPLPSRPPPPKPPRTRQPTPSKEENLIDFETPTTVSKARAFFESQLQQKNVTYPNELLKVQYKFYVNDEGNKDLLF